jgi:hypothetical protein
MGGGGLTLIRHWQTSSPLIGMRHDIYAFYTLFDEAE